MCMSVVERARNWAVVLVQFDKTSLRTGNGVCDQEAGVAACVEMGWEKVCMVWQYTRDRPQRRALLGRNPPGRFPPVGTFGQGARAGTAKWVGNLLTDASP